MYSVEYIKYVISIAFTAAYFVMANIRSMRFINSDVMSNREIESSTVYLTSTILPLSQPISYDLCTHAGNYKIMTTQHGDTHQGAETYENRWQDQNGTWFAPAGWKQTCGFTVYNNGNDKFLPMTPCVFDLSVDANETTNLAVSQPELLHELWLELNISWLGYYHSRSPAALLGPCNMPCAGKKWSKMAGGLAVLGPVCAVPGCDAHPFTPTNSTDCKFMANTGFSNRVPDHPLGVNAASQADCCRACYEDAYCVASAFHKADKSNKCYLHQAPPHQTSNTGVTGCVTTRLATYSPHSIHTAEIEAVYSPRAVVEE